MERLKNLLVDVMVLLVMASLLRRIIVGENAWAYITILVVDIVGFVLYKRW